MPVVGEGKSRRLRARNPMIAADLLAFVRASVPAPPSRLLEIGAGDGELARTLAEAGYGVLAIDPEPRGAAVRPAALHELDEPSASFDAALAVSPRSVVPSGPPWRLGAAKRPAPQGGDPDEVAR
jgi:predicted RNA methylase